MNSCKCPSPSLQRVWFCSGFMLGLKNLRVKNYKKDDKVNLFHIAWSDLTYRGIVEIYDPADCLKPSLLPFTDDIFPDFCNRCMLASIAKWQRTQSPQHPKHTLSKQRTHGQQSL